MLAFCSVDYSQCTAYFQPFHSWFGGFFSPGWQPLSIRYMGYILFFLFFSFDVTSTLVLIISLVLGLHHNNYHQVKKVKKAIK